MRKLQLRKIDGVDGVEAERTELDVNDNKVILFVVKSDDIDERTMAHISEVFRERIAPAQGVTLLMGTRDSLEIYEVDRST